MCVYCTYTFISSKVSSHSERKNLYPAVCVQKNYCSSGLTSCSFENKRGSEITHTKRFSSALLLQVQFRYFVGNKSTNNAD